MKSDKLFRNAFLGFALLLFGFSANASAQKNVMVIKGCEDYVRSAEIVYLDSKEVAIDMYNAAMRQGNCAKTWDAGSRGWAIQIKAGSPRQIKDRPVDRAPLVKGPDTSVLNDYNVPSDLRRDDLVIRTFTNKTAANAVYRSRLKSEGWARMWYDGGKRVWIVATRKSGNYQNTPTYGNKNPTVEKRTTNVRVPQQGGGDLNVPRDLNVNDLDIRTFVNMSEADAYYQQRMKTEKWGKMWYAPNKDLWVVATKKR